AGGIGTSTFTYKTSVFANGYNSWKTKTVETLPDGNQKITYSNFAGEAMLAVDKEVGTGQEWRTYRQYDALGRLTLTADPSAVTSYDGSTKTLSGGYKSAGKGGRTHNHGPRPPPRPQPRPGAGGRAA